MASEKSFSETYLSLLIYKDVEMKLHLSELQEAIRKQMDEDMDPDRELLTQQATLLGEIERTNARIESSTPKRAEEKEDPHFHSPIPRLKQGQANALALVRRPEDISILGNNSISRYNEFLEQLFGPIVFLSHHVNASQKVDLTLAAPPEVSAYLYTNFPKHFPKEKKLHLPLEYAGLFHAALKSYYLNEHLKNYYLNQHAALLAEVPSQPQKAGRYFSFWESAKPANLEAEGRPTLLAPELFFGLPAEKLHQTSMGEAIEVSTQGDKYKMVSLQLGDRCIWQQGNVDKDLEDIKRELRELGGMSAAENKFRARIVGKNALEETKPFYTAPVFNYPSDDSILIPKELRNTEQDFKTLLEKSGSQPDEDQKLELNKLKLNIEIQIKEHPSALVQIYARLTLAKMLLMEHEKTVQKLKRKGLTKECEGMVVPDLERAKKHFEYALRSIQTAGDYLSEAERKILLTPLDQTEQLTKDFVRHMQSAVNPRQQAGKMDAPTITPWTDLIRELQAHAEDAEITKTALVNSLPEKPAEKPGPLL
jgi:hypothetical protein